MTAREAITEAIHLYCHAIDRRRWPLMERVFHPDATYRFAAIAGDWRAFVEQARALIDPMPMTHHQIGNILIRMEGEVAQAESYVTVHHRVPADYPPGLPFAATGTADEAVVGARYVDRFERRGSLWRIAGRTGLFDWRHDRAIADGGLSLAPPSADDPALIVSG